MTYKIDEKLPWFKAKDILQEDMYVNIISEKHSEELNPNGLFSGFLSGDIFFTSRWNGFHFEPLNIKQEDISDVLLKSATLNNFYSTNIFSIYPVAKHICSLDIDSRLITGDVTLVQDIQYLTISDTQKNFYSFASKYCSHHNPLEYPIYDSFVDEILRYFRNRDGFSDFQDGDLKDYVKFKSILINFSNFFGLNKYNLKQIDQYVWQLGKEYFPKNYGKKKRDE